MNQAKLRIATTALLVSIVLIGTLCVVANVQARCRWVWQGTSSHYVCDEDQDRPKGISICDFTTDRGRNGAPRTITVFCRPDGSPWKEVIVGPKRVVVKILRRDGSVKEKKRIDISQRGAPVAERIQKRKSPRDKPQWIGKDWRVNVMGRSIKGRVERKKNDIKGYLKVPMPFTGKRKIYNFRGRINGRDVSIRSGGHSFRGKIRPDGKLAGNVYIDGGPTVPLVSPVPLP